MTRMTRMIPIRSFVLAMLSLACHFLSHAQDVIVKKNSDEIRVKITEVNTG